MGGFPLLASSSLLALISLLIEFFCRASRSFLLLFANRIPQALQSLHQGVRSMIREQFRTSTLGSLAITYVAGPQGPRRHSGVSVVLHFSQIRCVLSVFFLPRLRLCGIWSSSGMSCMPSLSGDIFILKLGCSPCWKSCCCCGTKDCMCAWMWVTLVDGINRGVALMTGLVVIGNGGNVAGWIGRFCGWFWVGFEKLLIGDKNILNALPPLRSGSLAIVQLETQI